ncbi:Protein of unknown function [Pyronema omphalodes CBS 100304]|uniref:Uncharacterized protein n=1 Tax=Pyronema omphalodes (strain CBS 100304) TaxID=1076935 RepID=U4LHZ6_PYROM|nr:Protein of unknown function [Pyronema omphalodes CBS 100304]
MFGKDDILLLNSISKHCTNPRAIFYYIRRHE